MKSILFWAPLVCLLVSFSANSEKRFVILGDTGKDNDGQKAVSEAITQYCQDSKCDYGLLTGDNIYPVGMSRANDPIIKTMFDKYYGHLNFPFLIALGNHDYGKYSNDWRRGRYEVEYARTNPQFLLPHFFYYIEGEDYVMAVLDSSRLMWAKDIEEQKDMIDEAYARSLGKWFFVTAHHPYLSNGQHGNAGHYERVKFPSFVSGIDVKEFVEQNVCGRAHIYFSGHDHNLQVTDGMIQNCPTLFVLSGAGASTEKLADRNRTLFQAEKLGFFTLSVNTHKLLLNAFDENLQLLYSQTLEK